MSTAPLDARSQPSLPNGAIGVVRRARGLADLRAVGRLRYRYYVEERGQSSGSAVLESGLILDEADREARIFVLERGGRVVGTVRSFAVDESSPAELREAYALRPAECRREAGCWITGSLIVDRDQRGSRAWLRLASAAYEAGLVDEGRRSLVRARPELRELYLALGYRLRAEGIAHPQHGVADVLELDVRDEAALSAVRSPFLPLLRAHHRRAAGTATQGVEA